MVRFWRENRVLLIAFVGVLSLVAVFAIGTFRHAREWDGARDQPIQAWMTPRYIAHSWDLPREVMTDQLGFERTTDGPQPLTDIADERGVPVAELIAEIEAVIAAYRMRSE